MRQAAVPAHRYQPPGQAAVVDIPGEVLLNPLQPLRIQPYLCRINLNRQRTHYTASSGDANRCPWQPARARCRRLLSGGQDEGIGSQLLQIICSC
jgi:hypothetical protein